MTSPSGSGARFVPEHHHRDIRGGGARAAMFGVSDGLVSNVSLILGVVGASPAPGIVRLAGMAGLVSGAFSMAFGEYISVRAQAELFQRELDLERRELHRRPENERRELVAIYRSRGLSAELAEELATEMSRDLDLALETHAREELGFDPEELGNPVQAAVSSFIAFAFGALVPLLPWFFGAGTAAALASIGLGAVAALTVGAVLARFTGRSALYSAFRQLGVAILAASITYAVGRAVGATSAV